MPVVQEHGLTLINAVHPAASVSASATLGRNVVIAARAVVCAEARVEDLAIINTAAVVDHECVIGRAAHVCPGAILAGRVHVGAGAFIGIGANVIQCLNVGANAIVGAGAVVLRDVPGRHHRCRRPRWTNCRPRVIPLWSPLPGRGFILRVISRARVVLRSKSPSPSPGVPGEGTRTITPRSAAVMLPT